MRRKRNPMSALVLKKSNLQLAVLLNRDIDKIVNPEGNQVME